MGYILREPLFLWQAYLQNSTKFCIVPCILEYLYLATELDCGTGVRCYQYSDDPELYMSSIKSTEGVVCVLYHCLEAEV